MACCLSNEEFDPLSRLCRKKKDISCAASHYSLDNDHCCADGKYYDKTYNDCR